MELWELKKTIFLGHPGTISGNTFGVWDHHTEHFIYYTILP
ncbi:Hypothetical predicted protein [Podarcis lilfordi]|uniref:Uncharacterized protein n=1 Tax=Podarcis lilfordi TaxID=74358 RepID=A0AA35K8M2_9SAUR|nr:Hypothetical predicted protein [Podarcis lilfordi]